MPSGRILLLEELVAADPQDFLAHRMLGNEYLAADRPLEEQGTESSKGARFGGTQDRLEASAGTSLTFVGLILPPRSVSFLW